MLVLFGIILTLWTIAAIRYHCFPDAWIFHFTVHPRTSGDVNR